MVKPQAKRIVIQYLIESYQLSERRACGLLKLERSSYRYVRKPKSEEAICSRLRQLAVTYPVYGYLLLHGLLKQEGWIINKKRTYRLYKQMNLQVRTKQRKKLCRPRQELPSPQGVNKRWSMDFVSDQLADGRRFRVLNVVDDFSRECIGQLVGTSISGYRVSQFLAGLIPSRNKPDAIVCDNGPEFTSKALFFWARENGVKLSFIQPGKPQQNAFVESFNGKFRSACLNQSWFRNLTEAETIIAQWRQHYNEVRPHSSLNYLPPSVFARKVA